MSLIFELLIVFCIAFALTALWLAVAIRRQWFDHPNARSAHATPVPKSGGIGFVVAFVLFTFNLWRGDMLETRQLLALDLALILAVTGMLDDFMELSIRVRLTVQCLTVLLVTLILQPQLMLLLPGMTLSMGLLSAPLLVLGLVWLVNLYNFMDGIDALAATECVFVCLALAWLGGDAGSASVFALALGLAVSVTGFLYFNLPGARLFMGDLGSNFLGLVLGVIAIMALQAEVANIWTIAVLFSIFFLDSTTTLIGRMRAGVVWYHGHNSHAYQRAAAIYGHGIVVMAVALINALWVLPAAWLTVRFPEAGLVILAACLAPLLGLWLYCKRLGDRDPAG
jgi:Fuc2NAc and GlcNAc transferase